MRYGRTLVASQKTRSQVSRNDTINSMVHFGHFNPEWMANFRLEMVKQKILKELLMDKRPPRMDTKRNSIPKPVFNGLLDSMKETVKDQEDEDDYFGKTTEIVIPAEEGKQCLLAKLSPTIFSPQVVGPYEIHHCPFESAVFHIPVNYRPKLYGSLMLCYSGFCN